MTTPSPPEYWEVVGITEIEHTVTGPFIAQESGAFPRLPGDWGLDFWHAPRWRHPLDGPDPDVVERKPLAPGTIVLMLFGCDHNGFCDVIMPDGSKGCFHITNLKLCDNEKLQSNPS